jgi:hypothetical protein
MFPCNFWSTNMIRPFHEYALYTLAAFLLWFILIQHAAVAAADDADQVVVTTPVMRQPAAPDRAAIETTTCARCGVIESVRETTRDATRSIAIESGYARYAVALLSLLIGAKHANPADKEARPPTCYEITVRFDDGSRRVLTELIPPKWKAGDRVMVINGEIRPSS